MKKSRKPSRRTSTKTPGEDSVNNPASPREADAEQSIPAAPEPAENSQKIYRMQAVAGHLNEQLRKEIAAIWISGGSLSPEDAGRRCEESVIVLRQHEGSVVGVTAAHPVLVPGIGLCWFLRMFLLPEHRGFLGKNGLGLPSRMLGATMAFLAEKSAAVPKNRPVGVLMVLENKKLQSERLKRAFESNGWQFAGTTPDGAPALFHPLVYHVPEGGGGHAVSA